MNEYRYITQSQLTAAIAEHRMDDLDDIPMPLILGEGAGWYSRHGHLPWVKVYSPTLDEGNLGNLCNRLEEVIKDADWCENNQCVVNVSDVMLTLEFFLKMQKLEEQKCAITQC